MSNANVTKLEGVENMRYRARIAEATHVILSKGEDHIIRSIEESSADDLHNGIWVKVIQPYGLRGAVHD